MAEKDIFGLIAALVIANWSAMGIALKCWDKIDASRNLLWGISSDPSPESKEILEFIMRYDIKGFVIAFVWVLCSVGSILIYAGIFMRAAGVDLAAWALYLFFGFVMIASGIGTGIVGFRSCKTIETHALKQLNRSKS